MLKLDTQARRIPRAVLRYGLAILSVAVALVITNSLVRYTTLRTPLFYLAVIISTWFGGRGPGILAVVLSTAAVDYSFALHGQLPEQGNQSRPFVLLFSISALVACWITIQRRRAEKALESVRDQLQARVEERTAKLSRTAEQMQAEIHERKQAEEKLRERANLLDLTHDTVMARDMNDVIIFWNRGAEQQYGWTRAEAIGRNSHDLYKTIFPAPLEEITAELTRTGRWEGELIHTRRDGTQVVVASRWALRLDPEGNPVTVLETNNDITGRRRAEEALHKAQTELTHVNRVATLGEITASIAHEVNQPLAAVVTNANACLRWLAHQPPNLYETQQALSRIVKAGDRASEVIGRIRALVSKSPPQKIHLDVNEVVLDVITLLRTEVQGHRVSLKTQLSDLPPVLADRVQLQQVILNLIMNALEAMNDVADGSRKLQITSETHDSSGVLISVKDSGKGVDANCVDHLFDAFFTTKPEGMGMGLAICRSIIEAHGGRLWASANSPQGAVFQFTLPTADEKMA